MRFLLFSLFSAAALVLSGGANHAAERAHFRVTNDVIQADIEAFTATVGRLGDDQKYFFWNSGFEPVIYRDRIVATRDDPSRVYASPNEVTVFDLIRTGALDEAEVDLYRIVDGVFTHVGRSRVVPGGHQASGWQNVNGENLIEPDRDFFSFSWRAFERKGVPAYFALAAVDRFGNVSEPSAPVSVIVPEATASKFRDTGIFRPKFERSRSARKAPSPPQNVRIALAANGIATLAWDAADGDIAGYRLLKSETAPEAHQGFFFELEPGGTPVRSGDLAMISKKLYGARRADFVSNRAWTALQGRQLMGEGLVRTPPDQEPGLRWQYAPHEGAPFPRAGETYLRAAVETGKTLRVGGGTHSGSEQDFYEVPDPNVVHEAAIWLRGPSEAKVELHIENALFGPSLDKIGVWPLAVGPTWKEHRVRFRLRSVPADDKPRSMHIRISGPASVDLDDFRIAPEGAGRAGLSPWEADEIRVSGMSAIRFHSHTKTKRQTYDLQQFTNPAGLASGIIGGGTLPKMMRATQMAGSRPWLQVEPHFSPEEWAGLAEYLAGPAESGPWAAKRAAQGQTEPWTDAFDRIYFEVGNEMWNQVFKPWTFPAMVDAVTGKRWTSAEVYGLYLQHVLTIFEESPHWPALESKLVPVVGGWNVKPEWGAAAMSAAPNASLMTVAAYNGGWDEGEGPPRENLVSFFNLLNQVSQAEILVERHVAEKDRLEREGRREIDLGTYEGGPGYVQNGLNGRRVTADQGAAQERVMKSVAAGSATLDNFLMRMRHGFRTQNFFTFGPGVRWKSHAFWYRGGQAYPSWQLISRFNREAGSDLLDVRTKRVPTADLPGYDRRTPVNDAPQVAAYATRNGDRVTLTLVSRRLPGFPDPGDDGMTKVTVDLPFRTADSIEAWGFDVPFDAENSTGLQALLMKSTLPVPDDLSFFEVPPLPPGQTVMYVFSGVSD